MKKVLPLSLRQTRSCKHNIALALSLPAMVAAVTSNAQDDEFVLETMQIEERTSDTNPYAESGAPYKAKISGDSRRVKPLAETPQTISVITETAIKDSGVTDLKDLLNAQPGITLGTGENGNAFGDRYIIRGHEARSDVFVDGLRDPGMTTRETFAVEQVEITKGPSSTFAGRGSTGGAVNSITKQANSEYSFNKVEGTLGTDELRRITLDSNLKLADETAARFNVLHAYQEVPNRGPADRERNGLAASITNTGEKLSLAADVYYLDAEDLPDLGVYIRPNGAPVDDLPVYAQKQDFLESEVRAITGRISYDASEAVRLQNMIRYGTTDNGYVTTGARGVDRAETDPQAPGAPTVSLSTHQGWQEVDYFVNQSNVFIDTAIGESQHQLLLSLEYSDLNVKNGIYDVANTAATNCVTSGRRGDNPGYCIVDAQGNYIVNNSQLMGRSIEKGRADSDFNIKTWSLAMMDTVDLNDKWTIHGGLRIDAFDYTNDIISATETVAYTYSDELLNGHVGLVYNIQDNGNVYFTVGTATNINGGESDLGANCGYGGICTDAENVGDPNPETTTNIELGTKWNIVNEKLLFTAAVFQITKDDVMESLPNGLGYDEAGTINTGKNRVKGIELSLTGNITEDLSTQFGVSAMDSEVLESTTPENIGLGLANFAENSVYAQVRYQVTPKFALGGSITYSSEMYAGQPDTAAGETYKIPSYTVADLFASYDFTQKLSTRVNIGNITDEDYYLAAYRSGAFAYKGDEQNVKAALVYEF